MENNETLETNLEQAQKNKKRQNWYKEIYLDCYQEKNRRKQIFKCENGRAK